MKPVIPIRTRKKSKKVSYSLNFLKRCHLSYSRNPSRGQVHSSSRHLPLPSSKKKRHLLSLLGLSFLRTLQGRAVGCGAPVPVQGRVAFQSHLSSISDSLASLPLLPRCRTGRSTNFAANTHRGLYRGYNEDRVFVSTTGRTGRVYALLDGHGGSECSHWAAQLQATSGGLATLSLVNNTQEHAQKEVSQIVAQIEKTFLDGVLDGLFQKTAGSCLTVFVDLFEKIMFVNLGDSRIIRSEKNGLKVVQCTVDHKPDNPTEMQRIFKAGGEIYRARVNQATGENELFFASNTAQFDEIQRIASQAKKYEFGPWRVKPGGLSVSRTIGDIESKVEEFDGLPGAISSIPDVLIHDKPKDLDYVLIACDGIFDVLSNKDVNEIVWETIWKYKRILQKEKQRSESKRRSPKEILDNCLSECVNNVILKSMIEGSEDNLTVILVLFKDVLKINN